MSHAATLTASAGRARTLAPGVLACAVVGTSATFLSQHYGAPVMLFALLLGMAMNFLSGEGPCAAGIEFTARQVLRIGIALLGLRITFAQVQALGWAPVLFIDVSRWLLVISIAGIGMKTHLGDLVDVGLKPVLLMIGETIFLAVLTLACLHWLA